MQTIAEWLANIGLEQYAPGFADNDIDISVLPHLTDADLEKIGVSLGHRRKMLAAIADVGSATTLTEPKHLDALTRQHPPIPTPTAAATSTFAAETAGERRHVTVSSAIW